MNNRIIKESSNKQQYEQIKAMGKQGYHAAGFDNQGFVMTRIDGKWLLKVRVLRDGRIQRYKASEPSTYEKQVYA